MISQAGLETIVTREDPVPNDWIHGLRRSLAAATGRRWRLLRPSNPVVCAAVAPLSATAALSGRSSRVRLLLRRAESQVS